MTDSKYAFQYCQKIIVFSEDWSQVLLARRRGEADYDGTFSFIGGKMEATDKTIIEGVRREKNEEIGETARLKLYTGSTRNLLYRKADSSNMILPHYLAHYLGGEIKLNYREYSEYCWVSIPQLAEFEPKVENIPEMVDWALSLKICAKAEDLIDI